MHSGIGDGSQRVVQVAVPREVLFDLPKMQEVQKLVLGRLGCGGCTSGFNIHFLEESVFVVRETAGKIALGIPGFAP